MRRINNRPSVIFSWQAETGCRWFLSPKMSCSSATRQMRFLPAIWLLPTSSTNQQVAWVEGHTWTIRDSQGNITHYESALLDITEHKSVQDALEASASNFRNLTEASLVGVFIIQGAASNMSIRNLQGYTDTSPRR
jgi:PAS domain-containing protein